MFVALLIHHESAWAVVILSSMARPAQQYFPTYLTNGMIWGGGGSLHVNSVFWFSLQLSFQTFLILRRIERDIINVHSSSGNVRLILVNVNVTCHFISRVSKKISNPSSGIRDDPSG